MADSTIQLTVLSGFVCLLLFGVVSHTLYRAYPLISVSLATQQRCLGIALALLPLWYLKAGIHPGLEMHFLGLTVATLMVGWRLSLMIGLANLLLLAIWQGSSIAQLGVEGLLGVSLPIAISIGILHVYRRYSVQHFFAYIFVCGFLAAALAMLGRHLTLGLFYLFDGQHSPHAVLDDYLNLWPLMLFPEALLNGMAVALMATYRPQWLGSYKENPLN